MIRINLLPHRELARAARRQQFKLLLGLAVGLGAAIVIAGQMLVSARENNQSDRNAYLQREIAKLDAQIGEIKTIRASTDKLVARKQVVETLQADRTEIVHLFDDMVRLLPEGVYLKSLKQTGAQINLVGYAQSSARVSSLMRALDDSRWFDSPQLIEIKAATVKNQRVSEFSLSVNQTPPVTETPGRAS